MLYEHVSFLSVPARSLVRHLALRQQQTQRHYVVGASRAAYNKPATSNKFHTVDQRSARRASVGGTRHTTIVVIESTRPRDV